MPAFILGGIYGGVMTPTEAAGVAVIYARPIGFFVYKGLNRHNFWEGLRESATTIGVVMVMVFMVLIVSRFLIFEDIPGQGGFVLHGFLNPPNEITAGLDILPAL